jgi:N6-adenosine-specific RNA methylase IME4
METTMLEYHPIANIFPLMAGDDYAALVADIAEHGQHEPIWLHPDGRIIDGRNRYRACCDLGVVPEYRTWDGNGSLVAFIVSLNLHRRHLTSSQRAVIALDVLPMLEEEARARMVTGVAADPVQRVEQGRSVHQAAAMTGTNHQYVSDAKRIAQTAPDLLENIRSGETTITAAKREIKERRREERREVNRQIIETVPTVIEAVQLAKFATIVIDPPWDWGDENDVDQFGRARPTYNTMTIGELMTLPVYDLADTDCHLYMWITNRSLPKGFALLEAWGFRYITCLTWVKPSFGMGNYFRGQTEQVLFGVRGSQPLKRHDVGTVFQAPRGPNGHSSKPLAFMDLVESCSPGPYLEMFSRSNRLGWTTWGETSANSI